MSQTSTDAQIVAEFRNMLVIFIRSYTTLARTLDHSVTSADMICSMTALVAYGYIITLEQERTMVWHRKWTLATWLFVANRYLLIAFTISGLAPTTSSSCAPAQIMADILIIFQNIVFAVFSALRVFALWDRNVPMTLLVLALNLVPVAVDIFTFSEVTDQFIVDPLFGTYCTTIDNFSDNVFFDFTLGTRIATSLGDALVLVVTWVKTAKNLAEGAQIGMRTPLSTMLLRDGTIYFANLLVMNIAQVVVRTVPSFQSFDFVTIVIATLQPILISRFLLNLRQVGSPEIDSQEAYNSQFSVPGFRIPSLSSIVGNMGEDLDHGGPVEEVEAEAENYSGSIQAEEGAAPEEIIEAHPSSMDPTPSTSQLIHIA